MGELESYHFEMLIQMTVETEGTTMETPVTFIGDFVAPDRFQGEVIMDMMGQTMTVQTIMIGETVYIRDAETSEWQMTTGDIAPFSPEDFIGFEQDQIANMGDLELMGQSVLDGVNVYHLQGTLTAEQMALTGETAEGEISVDYWIGVEDGWVRQVNLDMQIIADIEETGEFTATMQVFFSEFNQDITIDAP